MLRTSSHLAAGEGKPQCMSLGLQSPQEETVGREATAYSPEALALTLGLGSGQQASGAWGEGLRREGLQSQLPSSGY